AASSAASCAANGVLLREPLKPRAPALAQESALPLTSVIVTIVLLKVDLMCAMPAYTFFLTTFFARFLDVAIRLQLSKGIRVAARLLLANQAFAGTFASASVGMRALTIDRQTAPVPQTSVAP